MERLTKFLAFVARHLGAAIAGAVGVLMAAYGFASQALELWRAGLPPWMIQIIGLLIFAAVVVILLYRFWADHLEPLGPARVADKAIARPTVKQAPEGMPATKASGIAAPARTATAVKPAAFEPVQHDPILQLHLEPRLERARIVGVIGHFQNRAKVALTDASVVVVSVEKHGEGEAAAVGRPLRLPRIAGGKADLTPHQFLPVRIVMRDLADVENMPPANLPTEGGRVDLDDNSTYVVVLELVCKSPVVTTITMQIDVGQQNQLAAKILSRVTEVRPSTK